MAFNISEWLPEPIQSGPPLPKIWNILWPWVKTEMITVSPTDVAQGQSLTIQGTGFTPGGGVNLCIDGTFVVGPTVGSDGAFSASLLVGNNILLGTQLVWAQDVSTGKNSNVVTVNVT